MVISITILICLSANTLVFADESTYPCGAIPMTEEELAEFKNTVSQIAGVNLNTLAYSRLTELNVMSEDGGQNDIVNIGNEITVYNDDSSIVSVASDNNTLLLPSDVDNSREDTFPPIGNQVGNSCCAWSIVYYQLTNNTNLIRGQKAKHNIGSESNPIYELNYDNIYSPRWNYNLIVDPEIARQGGTSAHDMYSLLINYGSPEWSKCTINSTASNTWSPDSYVWAKALKNKPESVMYIDINPNKTDTADESAINNVKALLANGYVLSFTTYIWSWDEYTDQQSAEKICVGMSAKKNNNGEYKLEGCHELTIVGYDDNKEIDINGDGLKEDREKGAFKVANSWGEDWGVDGCCWISYDALNNQSRITPYDEHRYSIIDNGIIMHLQPNVSYTPLLTAELTMKTNCREQICLYIGVSDTNSTTPAVMKKIANCRTTRASGGDEHSYWSNVAFAHPSLAQHTDKTYVKNVNFSGGEGYETQKFTFDLSQLLYSFSLEQKGTYRFYFRFKDNYQDGNYCELGEITIIDNVRQEELCNIRPNNANVDGSEITIYADCEMKDFIVDENNQILAEFNYPILSSSVNSDTVYIIDRNNILSNVNSINKFGKYTDLTFNIADNSKAIYINAPTNSYLSGTCYDLHITSGISTFGGNHFDEDVITTFYVK